MPKPMKKKTPSSQESPSFSPNAGCSEPSLAETLLAGGLAEADFGVLAVTPDERIRYFNTWIAEAIRRAFGLTLVVGNPLPDIPGERHKWTHWESLREKILQGEGHALEYQVTIESESHFFEMSFHPSREGSRITGFLILIRDITRYRKNVNSLMESFWREHVVIEQARDGIALAAEDGHLEIWNPAMERLTGYPREEVNSSVSFLETLCRDEAERQKAREHHRELLEHKTRFLPKIRLQTREGEEKWASVASTLVQKDGKTMFLSIFRDITDGVWAEAKLREVEKLLAMALEATNEGVFDIDLARQTIWCSPRWFSIREFDAHEFPLTSESWQNLIHPDDRGVVEKMTAALSPAAAGDFEIEYRARKKSGEYVWVLDRGKVVERGPDGAAWRVVGTSRENTQMRTAQEAIRQSLAEKEVLLRELHHRVKNNFATLISLLGLQMESVAEDRIKKSLNDLQGRIMSMSLVHESLYQTENMARINLGRYLEDLAGNLFESLRVTRSAVLRAKVADDITVDLETAIPCGLIVNELLTNSFKYAWPAVGAARPETPVLEIRMDLRAVDDAIELQVSDNGRGFLPEQAETGGSLGLRLIRILVRQLRGDIGWETSGGAKFFLRFRERKRNRRIPL
jgi:PAS domain S-box-containing protein